MIEIEVPKMSKGEEFIHKILDYPTLTIKWDEVGRIPEFKKLKVTEQTPIWHGEGNAWNHTKNVVEEIYKLCPIEPSDAIMSVGEGSLRWRRRYYLVLAALFHDIGKGVTTKWNKKKKDWSSPRHDEEGEKIVRRLLWDLDYHTRELICSLVRNHMKPLYVFEKEDPDKEIIALSEETNGLDLLITLKRADCGGSVMQRYDGWRETLDEVEKKARTLNCYNESYFFNDFEERHQFYFGEGFPKTLLNVYVLIGLPGSGKSTYYEDNLKDKGIPIVSRDIIRSEIGLKGDKPQGNQKQEEQVTKIFNERLKEYAENNFSIAIDNTSLKQSYRDGFKRLLKKYQPFYTYVYVEAPTWEETLERRKGQIPEHIIANMRKSFEFPRPCEYDVLIVNKQTKNEYQRVYIEREG